MTKQPSYRFVRYTEAWEQRKLGLERYLPKSQGYKRHYSLLKNELSSLPSLPEQEVIGSFFQDLDKAIAKQEEKVNQLKESKQTLLRKMFI